LDSNSKKSSQVKTTEIVKSNEPKLMNINIEDNFDWIETKV